MKTMTEKTIWKELSRIKKAKRLGHKNNKDSLYGAEQALLWVLKTDSMAPSKAFAESLVP